ncbi:unnamed protein product [Vicia faba]|uniref:E2 ubiquitin-conjugating enzyme n=1 Tax=Vicia faba TaxID=3906 RepID=A0AAV0Z6I2_VICFA|nr:unnamed protein product [Vicia faba]
MGPEVVQIPPSMFQRLPRFKKQKQSIIHDVIDIVDDNENEDDYLMILDEITRKHNKGKASEALHEGYGDKSRRFMKSVCSKVKSVFFGSKKHGLADNPDAMKLPYSGKFESAKLGAGSSSSFHSDLVGENGSLHPSGVESGKLWSKSYYSFVATHKNVHGSTSALKSASDVHNGATVVLPQLTIIDETENESLRKLRSFKLFDSNPKSWAKKIQEEWKILEKHLPDTIFVRVYESRMNLMRVVIIGAERTPYHDGLFFFDIFFPSGYPNVPPKVHYHSGGLRINPNLYNCSKVCLSILNTWPGSGSRKEKWTKGVSTILQVLVSIQGLILNIRPYFNEPGYECLKDMINGEKQTWQYNEKRFILSLRTMMYTIRKPPKNFEDLVVGHFYSRAHDILASCKAYMNGVQVGCLVKGGVQDVNGSEGKQSSAHFISGLAGCVPSLVQEFKKVGVNECKKLTSPVSEKPSTFSLKGDVGKLEACTAVNLTTRTTGRSRGVENSNNRYQGGTFSRKEAKAEVLRTMKSPLSTFQNSLKAPRLGSCSICWVISGR